MFFYDVQNKDKDVLLIYAGMNFFRKNYLNDF